MADAATTAVDRSGRTVAVYCGAGLSVEVPLAPPTTVVALGKAVVDKLRESRELAHITPLDVVLWRVCRVDARRLWDGGDLSDASSRAKLHPEDAIEDDTFTADHRIWVQLLGGGAGACVGRARRVRGGPGGALQGGRHAPGGASWTASTTGCSPWCGVQANPARPLICTTLPPSCNVPMRFPSACRDRATRLQARPRQQRRPQLLAAALP
jgi:hypothetical protein